MKTTSNKILMLFMLIMTVMVASASEYEDDDVFTKYFNDTPSRKLTAECRKVLSPSSLCNKGTEPFMSFLKKFKTNKQFRNSRVKNLGNNQWAINELGNWTCKYNFPVYQRNTRCDKSIATWYAVKENSVKYWLADDLPCEDGGSGLGVVFERIGGKWFVVAVMMAG